MKEKNNNSKDELEKLKAKQKENPNDFEITKQLADLYLELDRPEDAFVHLKKALELDPKYAQGYNHLGVLFLTQNKLEEAEQSLINALKLDFNLIDAHFNLGALYQKVGKDHFPDSRGCTTRIVYCR